MEGKRLLSPRKNGLDSSFKEVRVFMAISLAECLNHFVLIEACSVDILVACLRMSAGFYKEFLQRDASRRALWSDRQNCSHDVSKM